MLHALQRLCTRRNLAILLTAVFILSLIPPLVLSFYSYPQADDFNYGSNTYHVVQAGGSAIDVLQSAWRTVKDTYNNWQGTYAAIFLFALQPAVFGIDLYFITTWIMLALLIVSTMRLLSVLICDCLKKDRSYVLLIGTVLLTVTIQFMPSAVEAFYWYNGAIYYIGFQSAMLFYLTEGILFFRDGKSRRIVFMTVLAAIIGGGNYVTALLTVEITVLLLFLLRNKKKTLLPLLIPAAVLLVCFAISMLAPGNAQRAAEEQGLDAIRAIYKSFGMAIRFFSESFHLHTLIAVLFLLPILYYVVKDAAFSFPFPLLVAGVSFLLYVSSFTPTMYALDGAGDPRVRNIRYALFLLLLVFCMAYTLGWLVQKLREDGLAERMQAFVYGLRRKYGLVFAGAMLAAFFCSVILANGREDMLTAGSLRSLQSGEAAAYLAECQARQAMLESDDAPVVTLPGLQTTPPLLFLMDLQPGDGTHWSNANMARYFDKERILLEE